MKKIFICIIFLTSICLISCNDKDKNNANNENQHLTQNSDSSLGLNGNEQKNVDDVGENEIDQVIENENIENPQKTFNITYIINDVIWDEVSYENFNIDLYKYCSDSNNESNIVNEIEWYDEENIKVDKDYVVDKDVVLNGEIISKFILSPSSKKFEYIIYSKNKYVELPSQYYYKLSYNGVSTIVIKDLIVDKTYNYTQGILPDKKIIENILYSSSKYYKEEKVEIEKIKLYAENLEGIISENSFAYSEYIKEIEIIGDIKEISKNAFFNLPNLEKIVIHGNVENIHEEYATNCGNFILEITK